MIDWRDTDVSSIASSVRNALVGGPFGPIGILSREDYKKRTIAIARGKYKPMTLKLNLGSILLLSNIQDLCNHESTKDRK